MRVDENKLILESEVNDMMLDEFIELAYDEKVTDIIIETDNVSSLIVQQLFCLKQSKNLICNDPFLQHFFEDIRAAS